MPAILTLDHVSVTFGDTSVLSDVHFRAHAGEITALLGINGAGKTTAIRSVCGLLPYRGTISIDGQAPGTPQASCLIGVMPQETGAWSGVRVGELLHYLAGLYDSPQPVAALMEHLHITDLSSKSYRRLSGGQRQLVNLAGAMIGRCPLVILDEPTAGMDLHVRKRTWRTLELLRDGGAAVVLATHDMSEVDALATHVSILHGGRIAYAASAEQLRCEGGAEDVFMRVTT